MDTMQLSAVKREMVVFLKSKFQRGLFDLEMPAGILCCACDAEPPSLLQMHFFSLLLAWHLWYLRAEKVKAQGRVGLMLDPCKMWSFLIPEQTLLPANSFILLTHWIIICVKKLYFVIHWLSSYVLTHTIQMTSGAMNVFKLFSYSFTKTNKANIFLNMGSFSFLITVLKVIS